MLVIRLVAEHTHAVPALGGGGLAELARAEAAHALRRLPAPALLARRQHTARHQHLTQLHTCCCCFLQVIYYSFTLYFKIILAYREYWEMYPINHHKLTINKVDKQIEIW